MGGYIDGYLGGTDYIELDLQLTKDGYLVANHDPTLMDSTDVADYASLFKSKMDKLIVISGKSYNNDYAIIDFTLAELQILKRKQRYDFRSTYTNDKYNVVTLDEIIQQVNLLNEDFPRKVNTDTKVGLYIEIKNYDWYLSNHSIDMAEVLYAALDKNGLGNIASCENKIPIVIQSFF